ncbi:hypothetical protein SNOG_03914 [Parastagonospora nodorum SN15]|uniref:LCCL domain-containing protein n=1 Tax=Phaeosphaeria nodorum (strain SN15 / ATCC MYA-4574 / FGSC 10173) TaxID=321614 RepID=Q0UWF0_PHANO|nr:hypothetical protein SNOG_03914 [Parastagonospora nodorum SN15]EAT89119.1 hypothetical protein SNOG_03914 [Parastagonospora nodorum SN15]
MPVKDTANATTVPVDVEQGHRDQITPSASTSLARNGDISKPATPRRSLELDDGAPRNRNLNTRSPWIKFEAKLPAAVAQINHKIVSWMKGPETQQDTSHHSTIGAHSDMAHQTACAPASVVSSVPSAQSCGLDGRNCLPFADSSFAFNCPASCLGAQVLNPRAIGNTSINYRSLVVGGAPDEDEGFARVYRGDSFICGAAIHAGAIKNGQGGCGVVSLVGEKSSFPTVSQNGIIQCRVGMASDTPNYSNYASLASTILGRFLPAALVAALFYQFSIRKTLRNCKAHVEKTVLWVGAAWVGALSNYTLEKIPIQRLTGHDIRQQPGAITALVIIILILFIVILYQCWCLRSEGRLPRFLGLYAIFGISLGILSAMPHLTLRIHHYILALLLLPGTSMQTRISLLAQGLLVGLFINGVARWDFDSILQTAAQLRGDAQLGTSVPSILEPLINGTNVTFTWKGILRGYDGISVLINDVERFRGIDAEANFTWTRQAVDLPEYFRFGFINYSPFGAVRYSDFTKAGTWWVNGTWGGIPPGRT